MTEVENVNAKVLADLLNNTITNNTKTSSKNINEITKEIRDRVKNGKSPFLDDETLTKLKDGEFGITLKQFTNLSTYNTKMDALFGYNANNNLTNNLTNNLANNLTSNINSSNLLNTITNNLTNSISYNNSIANNMNNLLINGDNDTAVNNAKTFIETMKEYGMTNAGALKLYTAMSSYSVYSTLSGSATNSYVTANV